MKKISVDRSNPYRAILTDTLPYEIPLFFSNEPIYLAVTKSPTFANLPSIVNKLLATHGDKRPFIYSVQKGGDSFRTIGIPHPTAQLKFAELYRDFDSYVESICARSSFSLRYPAKVGSHFFQAQYEASDSTPAGSEPDIDPVSFKPQRRWASSYFYYRRYPHIRKFFLSEEFAAFEKRYSVMMVLDFARCFESIYTHTLPWAVRGKEFSKSNKRRFFFESEFDKRMREANWGETNGILIGPEVSRVFAECILQSIDVAIEDAIIASKLNCQVRRYVDDFFVFGNSDDDLRRVKTLVEKCSSPYGLHINESKTSFSRRPFVSKTSVARDRVISVLDSVVKSATASLDPEAPAYFSHSSADHVFREILRIAKLHDVNCALLGAPALAVIERGLSQMRSRLAKGTSKYGPRIVHSFLKMSSNIFLMDIRASTSHKLAKIYLQCAELNDLIGGAHLAFETAVIDSLQEAVYIAKEKGITGPEIINVLIAADSVCKKQKAITPSLLLGTLGLPQDHAISLKDANYFDLVSALYFSRRHRSFIRIRESVLKEIELRIAQVKNRLHEYTEETFLFFDFLSCPHIDSPRKKLLLRNVTDAYGVPPASLDDAYGAISKSIGFVAWNGAEHFQAMLARRELHPAYDS